MIGAFALGVLVGLGIAALAFFVAVCWVTVSLDDSFAARE